MIVVVAASVIVLIVVIVHLTHTIFVHVVVVIPTITAAFAIPQLLLNKF